jgi:hypothetical protein
MKTTALLNAFLLAPVRRGLRAFLASLRRPGAAPWALPDADAPHAFEVGRLPNGRPNQPKETGGSVPTRSPRKPEAEPPPPIPLGVHPDITRAHWKAAPRKRAHRYRLARPSPLMPLRGRASIAAPLLTPAGTPPSKGPDPSTRPSPLAADVDTAFQEMVEECCIDWPECLTLEKACAGLAERVAAALVVAGAVVLAQWTVLS